MNFQSKWDKRFMNIAKEVSSWSKDPSTKIGAVIVDEQNRIVSVGYNGFPRNVPDCNDYYENRELKYELIVHAEVNAILNANKSLDNCRIYVYPTLMHPNVCPNCAKTLAQTGIKEVIAFDGDTAERWQKVANISKFICDSANITYRKIDEQG